MNANKKMLFFVFILIISHACGQSASPSPTCPSLANGDAYTQSDFVSFLTDKCRYDRLLLPSYQPENVVYVEASAYIYFIKPAAAEDLNFKLHFLLQLRWTDPRLAYATYSPKRSKIIGEDDLRTRIWVPHIYMSNEQSSNIMGTSSKDVLLSIAPDGEVLLSQRLEGVLYCWMNLQKFPFDDQTCAMNLESWNYNSSYLQLKWETESPVRLSAALHLTEYKLLSYWTNESVASGDIINYRIGGGRSGNYSALDFTFIIGREIGYYMLDYFIPSMMIVAMSWVTFWLDPNATPPRMTVGTSTMLSFITLSSAQSRKLPKVSYIKASEVWFLGCTGFIFASLLEFAFVNTIWRRKKAVTLKKVNSKHILKGTLTPRLARKEMQKELEQKSPQFKCRSSPTLSRNSNSLDGQGRYSHLNVNSLSTLTLPTITTQNFDEPSPANSERSEAPPVNNSWTTMTPQEVAGWIDKRSRVMFPVTFVIFNIVYWTLVYCL